MELAGFSTVVVATLAARFLKGGRGEPQPMPPTTGKFVECSLNFKGQLSGSMQDVGARVTEALKGAGFGVLTTIDLAGKFKEKLGKDIPPCIILGACNPKLAYGMYQVNTDIVSLLPCNTVLREVAPGTVSVEVAKPSVLMKVLGDDALTEAALEADDILRAAITAL